MKNCDNIITMRQNNNIAKMTYYIAKMQQIVCTQIV